MLVVLNVIGLFEISIVFGDFFVFLDIFDNFLMVDVEYVLKLMQLTQKLGFVRFNVCRIGTSTWNLSTVHIRANACKVLPLSLVFFQNEIVSTKESMNQSSLEWMLVKVFLFL